jgi:hypothetical protein
MILRQKEEEAREIFVLLFDAGSSTIFDTIYSRSSQGPTTTTMFNGPTTIQRIMGLFGSAFF